MTAKTYFEK